MSFFFYPNSKPEVLKFELINFGISIQKFQKNHKIFQKQRKNPNKSKKFYKKSLKIYDSTPKSVFKYLEVPPSRFAPWGRAFRHSLTVSPLTQLEQLLKFCFQNLQGGSAFAPLGRWLHALTQFFYIPLSIC